MNMDIDNQTTTNTTTNHDEYLLRLVNISKSFGEVKALQGVSLNVRPGTVHALMGENGAGKSTLMKCLFGLYKKDDGEMYLDGKPINFVNPKQALENGVAMVHQELNQVTKRNIVDNLYLGRYKTKFGIISEREMLIRTKGLLQKLGINTNPKKILSELSVSERQMVEIAKAYSYNSKILVLDEPTSSLSTKEVEHLFGIIDMLKKDGCGIVYISHKMDEILRISDDVTVMRDGKWIATTPAKDLTMDIIIKQMVGRELSNRFPPKQNTIGETVLKVNNLTGKYSPTIKDVSFELKRGEILGVAGLQGSRRTELLETLFALRKIESGEVIYDGKVLPNNRTPKQTIKKGFALLTEERKATGIFGILPIKFNSTIANLNDYRTARVFLNDGKMSKDSEHVVKSMRVKTPNIKTHIGSLSGGNQQKVIIGRWLLTKPKVLLLDEPTRGIDVGAKYEIYQLINELAEKGNSIMVISSEMEELFGITDRMLVMSNGRLAGIVNTKESSQEEVMELSAKFV
ncbi:MAG: ATP-binding cassette domain-containing protein [Firmicutes bacterium]|nr:ATP-binding cassette domain-containing protein [Bacillota bacterium]